MAKKQSLKERFFYGNLLTFYGKQFLLSVNDTSSMDSIRWSAVPIGKGGHDAVDFYLPIEEMRKFYNDCVTGVAQTKIANDTGNYPTAYKWTGGNNGSKSLAIGGGKIGIRVQVSDSSVKHNYMVAISNDALMALMFYFGLLFGMDPDVFSKQFGVNPEKLLPGSYYDRLRASFLDGQTKRAERMDAAAEEAETVSDYYESDTENDNFSDAPAVENPFVEEKPREIVPIEDADDLVLELLVKGPHTENDEFYLDTATITSNGEKVWLMFRKTELDTNWYLPLVAKAAKGTIIKVKGNKKAKFVLFTELVE